MESALALTPLYGIGAFILAMAIGKTLAIANAIRWIAAQGDAYLAFVKNVEAKGGMNAVYNIDYVALFERLGGGFLPFGVKDYKLKRTTSSWCLIPTLVGRICGRLASAVVRRATKGAYIISTANFYLITVAIIILYSELDGTYLLKICYLLSIFMLLMNILISVEFIYGTLVFTNYVKYFHVFDIRLRARTRERMTNQRLTFSGIRHLLELLVSVLATGCSIVLLTSTATHDFVHGPTVCSTLSYLSFETCGLPTAILRSLYFTTTTISTTGFGDIVPVTAWGYLVAILLQAEGFVLISFAFAVLWSVKPDGR
jgi:hypothetical protein